MAEINLLENNNSSGSSHYGALARLLSKLLGVLLVLVILGYGALFAYDWNSARNLTALKAEVTNAQNIALKNKDRSEVVTRQEQLTQLETLINNHVYWSYLLPELARVTLKSAKYTEITAKRDGTLDLTVTLPNYSEVEKYLQIFDLPEYNQQFSNVKVVSIGTAEADKVIVTKMQLQLQFRPEFIKGKL